MIIEQRSEEWFQMRRGRITSSEIYKIMGKGEELSETAKTYLLEKVCELYGGVTEPATGAALTWGTELEPVAIEYYEKLTKAKVEKASFIPVGDHYGGSPDGLIPKEGIIEVKCPFKSANHFKHGMINTPEKFKKIAPNYYYQCISNMICAEARWCDFISYDPRVQEDYQMFIFRLHLSTEEATAVMDRVEVAFNHMKTLVKEIEAAKPKDLLLG
jgi:exodeoxyribonuclease (lambda-induced)